MKKSENSKNTKGCQGKKTNGCSSSAKSTKDCK